MTTQNYEKAYEIQREKVQAYDLLNLFKNFQGSTRKFKEISFIVEAEYQREQTYLGMHDTVNTVTKLPNDLIQKIIDLIIVYIHSKDQEFEKL